MGIRGSSDSAFLRKRDKQRRLVNDISNPEPIRLGCTFIIAYPLALAAGHDRARSRMTEEAKRHPDLHSLLTPSSYPEEGVMHTIHRTKF